MTIVARPVSETEVVAPGAKVWATTVVPVDDVTLIQQSDVVAPTRREYVAVLGAYVADELVELTGVYLDGRVVVGVVGTVGCAVERAACFGGRVP
jgi:hypothetical protein